MAPEGRKSLDIDDLFTEALEHARASFEGLEAVLAGDLEISTAETVAADAIARLREALERHPDNFAVAFTLGLILKSAGSVGEGVSVLRRASELRPDDPRPYCWIADAYWNAARVEMYTPVETAERELSADYVLSDSEMVHTLSQETVDALEGVINTTDEQERYLAAISRRSRAALGVDGPAAARTAIQLFEKTLAYGLVGEDEDWVRERLNLVLSYGRSRDWLL